MTNSHLPHYQPDEPRPYMKMAGMLVFLAGGIFCAVGAISVFSSYAHLLDSLSSATPPTASSPESPTGELPKYFWYFYIGLPLLGIGTALRVMERRKRRVPRDSDL